MSAVSMALLILLHDKITRDTFFKRGDTIKKDLVQFKQFKYMYAHSSLITKGFALYALSRYTYIRNFSSGQRYTHVMIMYSSTRARSLVLYTVMYILSVIIFIFVHITLHIIHIAKLC